MPGYTFNPTSSGNVEIYQNGQRISTGTPQYASQFGYAPAGGVPAAPTAYEQIQQAGGTGLGSVNQNPQPSQPVAPPSQTNAYVPPSVGQTQALQNAQTPTPTNSTTPQQSSAPTQTYTPPPAIPLPTYQQLPSAPTGSANSADQYLQQYLQSLNPTSQETQYQQQLDALQAQQSGINSSRDLGIQGVNEQPIATPFLTGQAAAITNRAAVQSGALGSQQVPLQQQLAQAQARRQSAMDVSKEALTYAQNKDQSANALAQTQYQNQVTQAEYQNQLAQQQYESQVAAQKAAQPSYTEVNPGNALVNNQTGQPVYKNPTSATQNSTSGTTSNTTTTASGLQSGKTFVSGNLNYTPADFQSDKNALIGSRGSDGFVDPAIYVKLYQAWIGKGGVTSDFLQVYPVKDYVNPAPQANPAVYSVIQQLRGTKSTTSSSSGAQLP